MENKTGIAGVTRGEPATPRANEPDALLGIEESGDRQFHLTLASEMMKRVDEWRREQPDIPNQSEAMRRLIEIGLADKKIG